MERPVASKRRRDERDDSVPALEQGGGELSAELAPSAGGPAKEQPSREEMARRKAKRQAKKQKLAGAQKEKGGLAAVVTPAQAREHPFEVDTRDHAETPFEAYRDIEPLLFRLALELRKDKAKLRIYDPFFCEGSVKTHLARLGFTTVINENRDFYADAAAGPRKAGLDGPGTPEFDVIVTNPPFSGDHITHTLTWAAATGKPLFLLLPDFIARKGHFASFVSVLSGGRTGPVVDVLSYMGPLAKAYMFAAPGRDFTGAGEGGEEGPDRPFHVFAMSFQCVWFVHLGGGASKTVPTSTAHATITGWWTKKYGPGAQNAAPSHAALAGRVEDLPQLAAEPLAKRKAEAKARPWRKKLNRQHKAGGGKGAPEGKGAGSGGATVPAASSATDDWSD
jgi:hypothetical protein